jgi:hypothetical protein
MTINLLKKASVLVVAFFLTACTIQSHEATVASARETVAEAACTTERISELQKRIEDIGGKVEHVYIGSEAKAILYFINNTPPPTDFKGDKVVVFKKDNLGAIVVADKGCITYQEQGPYEAIMSFVYKALRGNA